PLLPPAAKPKSSVGSAAHLFPRNSEPNLHLSLRARLPAANFACPLCAFDHQQATSRSKESSQTSDFCEGWEDGRRVALVVSTLAGPQSHRRRGPQLLPPPQGLSLAQCPSPRGKKP